jgi:hypothetical protein
MEGVLIRTQLLPAGILVLITIAHHGCAQLLSIQAGYLVTNYPVWVGIRNESFQEITI